MTRLIYTGDAPRPGPKGLTPRLMPGRTYEVEDDKADAIIEAFPDLKRT